MYNKLFVNYSDGGQDELNGFFSAFDYGDSLVLSNIEGTEIMKWAKQEIRRPNNINTIEIRAENNSGKIFNKFFYVTKVNNDTIYFE